MDLDATRITLLKRLAAGEEHSLATEDPLWALGLVEGEGDQVQITELGRAYLDALPRVEGEKTGGMRICPHFAPARFYRPRCGDFCVQKFCRHWVPRREVCIKSDPSGNTYEETEAHCGLEDGPGEV